MGVITGDSINRENVIINKSLLEIFWKFRTIALKKGIEFRYDFTLDDQESEIISNSRLINTIISNLIKNALSVTESGFISFGYIKRGADLEFYVSDTGKGLSDGELQLLSRSKNGNNNITSEGVRDRTNLNECISLLNALGGIMRVESDPYSGSVFYFTIPYNRKRN
jgi:signal transduction histidine kinase